MRIVSALGVAIGLAVLPALPAAADTGERIISYDVVLDVQKDGSLHVQESISYDFGTNQRHGIEREIDTSQPYDAGHNRSYPISNITVSSEDAPDDVTQTGGGSVTTLRIGDPDRTVTGRHEYVIDYDVAAATTRYPDHDELYWNAVGPDWDVPVEATTVLVAGAPITKVSCFAGPPGSRASCSSVPTSGFTFRNGPIAAGDVVTMVVAFPPGSVANAAPILTTRRTVGKFFAGNPAVVAPVGLLAVGGPLFLLVSGKRRRRVQEEPGLAYRNQYQPEPPPGVRPMLANTLLGGRFKTVDPVAVLLDLSARGYVSITPLSKRNWRLVAVRPLDAGVPPEAQEVYAAAFRSGPDTTLAAASRGLTRLRGRLRTIARTEVVGLGWYSKPPRPRTGFIVLGAILVVLTIPLTLVLGFAANAALLGPLGFLGGVLLIVYGATAVPPRTEAGEIARSRLIAFRQTLAGIDPMRLPPERREAELAGLLPYAVVLGLAPQLASAFLAAGVVAGGYVSNPLWWSTFAGDATRATTPSSSSSGGGSGFSGGSAGGGGGGGGGGSW